MKHYRFSLALSPYKVKILLCSTALVILIMIVFSGKSRVDLETVAVSPSEKLIACFKTGDGPQILCFFADGTLAFEYNVNPDISAGGHCTLWFEDEILYALFYRTDKVICFSTTGTILKILDNEFEEYPIEFPHFDKTGHKFIYYGSEFDVVYDRGSFLGYWLLGTNRCLTILPKNGKAIPIMTWKAQK